MMQYGAITTWLDWYSNTQFVVEFIKELYWLLEIKLAATTAYHSQGDGQMERINQELEQYLWLFVNQRQDDWVRLLLFVEFQYDNHVHSATQQPPFLLDTGQVPHMGFKPGQRRSHLESVNEFKECMEGALEEAKATLAKSKDNMTKYYNQRQTLTLDYKPGDKVYLDATDIQTNRPSRKLSHHRLGPFPIVKKGKSQRKMIQSMLLPDPATESRWSGVNLHWLNILPSKNDQAVPSWWALEARLWWPYGWMDLTAKAIIKDYLWADSLCHFLSPQNDEQG